jgi:hypothetical protein
MSILHWTNAIVQNAKERKPHDSFSGNTIRFLEVHTLKKHRFYDIFVVVVIVFVLLFLHLLT